MIKLHENGVYLLNERRLSKIIRRLQHVLRQKQEKQ